eukprot:scaffold2324_cov266-Pinguiococcus_pyrenoidosus.AAC.7
MRMSDQDLCCSEGMRRTERQPEMKDPSVLRVSRQFLIELPSAKSLNASATKMAAVEQPLDLIRLSLDERIYVKVGVVKSVSDLRFAPPLLATYRI